MASPGDESIPAECPLWHHFARSEPPLAAEAARNTIERRIRRDGCCLDPSACCGVLPPRPYVRKFGRNDCAQGGL